MGRHSHGMIKGFSREPSKSMRRCFFCPPVEIETRKSSNRMSDCNFLGRNASTWDHYRSRIHLSRCRWLKLNTYFCTVLCLSLYEVKFWKHFGKMFDVPLGKTHRLFFLWTKMPECRDDADILRRHVATVSLSRVKARRPSSFTIRVRFLSKV